MRYLYVLLVLLLAGCGGGGGSLGVADKAVAAAVNPCGPQPPPETIVHQCPAGLAGSWSSSAPYVAAAQPTCWVSTGDFQPQSAPPDACTIDTTLVLACNRADCVGPLPVGPYTATGVLSACTFDGAVLGCTGPDASLALTLGTNPAGYWAAGSLETPSTGTTRDITIIEVALRTDGSRTLYDTFDGGGSPLAFTTLTFQ